MRAVLDIGDEKTGSKSRQGFVLVNKEKLLDSGFLSLKSTKVGYYDMGLAAYAGKPKFIKIYKEKNAILEDVDLDKYLETKIAEEIEGSRCHTVIFSFEGLMGLSLSEINKLTSMLRRHFSEILVIGFIKRQDKWAVSAYTTRLVNKDTKDKNVLYYFYALPRGRNYFEILKRWRKYIPENNLIFLDYDKYKDVVKTFVDIVGMPSNLTFERGRRNPSMSALGAEVLRRFNKDLSDSEKYKNRKAQVKQKIRKYYVGEPYLPPKREAMRLFRRFSRSNKKLAKALGGTDKYFFDEDFSRYPDKPTEFNLTLNEVEAYVNEALRPIKK